MGWILALFSTPCSSTYVFKNSHGVCKALGWLVGLTWIGACVLLFIFARAQQEILFWCNTPDFLAFTAITCTFVFCTLADGPTTNRWFFPGYFREEKTKGMMGQEAMGGEAELATISDSARFGLTPIIGARTHSHFDSVDNSGVGGVRTQDGGGSGPRDSPNPSPFKSYQDQSPEKF